MTKTKHPAADCTPAQREAFECICINDDTWVPLQIGKKLADKGLVVRYKTPLGLGLVGYRYHVPLPIHAQWCQWCSENVEDDE